MNKLNRLSIMACITRLPRFARNDGKIQLIGDSLIKLYHPTSSNRFADTFSAVPSSCANSETRNSSISQR